jgi:hypothetical protein
MAEAFVKTFKRDYVRVSPIPDPRQHLLSSIAGWRITTPCTRLTEAGNSAARRLLIEAAAQVSRELLLRQEAQPRPIREIAWKAQTRLCARHRRLARTGQAIGPTQVPRPRQLRDASTVMRFRPAHQRLINRRHNRHVSCPAQCSPKQALKTKPRIRLPATWKGGHESEQNLTQES